MHTYINLDDETIGFSSDMHNTRYIASIRQNVNKRLVRQVNVDIMANVNQSLEPALTRLDRNRLTHVTYSTVNPILVFLSGDLK